MAEDQRRPLRCQQIAALAGLQFHGGQRWVHSLMAPDADTAADDGQVRRLLLNWDTGEGKLFGLLGMCEQYAEAFRRGRLAGAGRLGSRAQIFTSSPSVPDNDGDAPVGPAEATPEVFVLAAPIIREQFRRELTNHPEFGYITHDELAELRAAEARATKNTASGLRSIYTRRITDPAWGGLYNFFGYKEFANALLRITEAGEAAGVTARELYKSSDADALREAMKAGHVETTSLLERLRNGFMAIDEVQHLYNRRETNQYGAAVLLALELLGEEAPRLALASATPLTGRADEVVDLLSLLIPDSSSGESAISRDDLFVVKRGASSESGLALRPGAAERIARLAAGRVSVITAASPADRGAAFPAAELKGCRAREVAYLRFTFCRAGKTQKAAVDAQSRRGRCVPTGSLGDIAYPTHSSAKPDPDELPGSLDALAGMSAAARRRAGVEWDPAARIRTGSGATMRPPPAGPFLKLPALARHSAKYAAVVARIHEHLRKDGGGKVMLYHGAVQHTGLLQIAEILKANGFGDALAPTPPGPGAVCAACGQAKSHRSHGDGEAAPSANKHTFRHARFITAHYYMDRNQMVAGLDRYNAVANAEGHDVLILLAASIIKEGVTVRAVRLQLVLSPPPSISALLQIFGRVVRRNSHAELPPEKRRVIHQILVTSTTEDPTCPCGAIGCYRAKVDDFLLIQQVMAALHAGAADRLRAGSRPGRTASLYAPAGPGVSAAEAKKAMAAKPTAAWRARGYGDQAVADARAALLAMLSARAGARVGDMGGTWELEELMGAVRCPGALLNTGLANVARLFDDGTLALALQQLVAEGLATARRAAKTTYVMRAEERAALPAELAVSLEGLAAGALADRFEEAADELDGDDALAVLSQPPELIRWLLENRRAPPALRALGAVMKEADLRAAARDPRALARGPGFRWRGELYQYARPGVAVAARMETRPAAELLGYFERGQFKLLPASERKNAAAVADRRTLARGRACGSYPRATLKKFLKLLGLTTVDASGPVSQVCEAIFNELLKRETRERAKKKPGPRWLDGPHL